MKTLPRISVITLTRNRALLLQRNLESLLTQTLPGDEIIIIDNASTDGTQAVIDAYRTRVPIRSFISHARGFPKLYNLAIRKAKNPIILFFDDDCVAGSAFIKHHRMAHAHEALHVIQGQTYSIPRGNIYADMMGDHYQNWLTVHTDTTGLLTTFDNKNASVPKRLLIRFGLFSEHLSGGAEDIELGIRWRSHGIPIRLDPTCLAYHHERTTLTSCLRQHMRFASTDAILAKKLPKERMLNVIDINKAMLHVKTALVRERTYLKTGNIWYFVYLPVLYLILFFTRIWGYATHE